MSGAAKGAGRGGRGLPKSAKAMLLLLSVIEERYNGHMAGDYRTTDPLALAVYTVYERLVLGNESCAAVNAASCDMAEKGLALFLAGSIEPTAAGGFESLRRISAGGKAGMRRRWHGAGATAEGADTDGADTDGADASHWRC